MKLERAINIDDLRRQAKARLPRIIFDFIEGGVEDEHCLRNNAAAFSGHRFLPRYYGDMGPVTQSTTIFGQDYAAPFGIGPTGLAGLFRPGADGFLAKAAAQARIPFVLSTVSNASLEEIAHLSGDYTWFQLYGARDRSISADLIRRAADCGIRTLVVTVDTPVSSKRERNMRNGFSSCWRLSNARFRIQRSELFDRPIVVFDTCPASRFRDTTATLEDISECYNEISEVDQPPALLASLCVVWRHASPSTPYNKKREGDHDRWV